MTDSILAGGAAGLYRAQQSMAAGASPIDLDRLPSNVKRAAEDFEAFYLTQAMGDMFAGVPLFGGGPGEGAFRSFLTQEYGKIIARSGGIGVADSVAREIIKLQEAK